MPGPVGPVGPGMKQHLCMQPPPQGLQPPQPHLTTFMRQSSRLSVPDGGQQLLLQLLQYLGIRSTPFTMV